MKVLRKLTAMISIAAMLSIPASTVQAIPCDHEYNRFSGQILQGESGAHMIIVPHNRPDGTQGTHEEMCMYSTTITITTYYCRWCPHTTRTETVSTVHSNPYCRQ